MQCVVFMQKNKQYGAVLFSCLLLFYEDVMFQTQIVSLGAVLLDVMLM